MHLIVDGPIIIIRRFDCYHAMLPQIADVENWILKEREKYP